jgi:hypothetical protein
MTQEFHLPETPKLEEQEREEYVEHLLEETQNEATSLIRDYRMAFKSKNQGLVTHLPYSNRNLRIVKQDNRFTFTVDGHPLDSVQAADLIQEFSGARKNGSDFDRPLPNRPVTIGETWNAPPDGLRNFARASTDTVEVDRSSITGRLSKVYRDGSGALWGVIEYKTCIQFEHGTSQDSPDRLDVTETFERPIDGSSLASKYVRNAVMAWHSTPNRIGRTMKGSEVVSVTPLK